MQTPDDHEPEDAGVENLYNYFESLYRKDLDIQVQEELAFRKKFVSPLTFFNP